MYRYGWGEGWKHRNDRPWKTRKKAGPRTAKFKAPWTVEQLWRCPFREERLYKTDGRKVWTEWQPAPAPRKTGVWAFDEWLDDLAAGNRDVAAFCNERGLRTSDIDGLSFVLTGLPAQVFMMKYRVLTLDVMLRHTNWPINEVARRSGFGSVNNVFLTCKREWNTAPVTRRKMIQKPEDLGRYR